MLLSQTLKTTRRRQNTDKQSYIVCLIAYEKLKIVNIIEYINRELDNLVLYTNLCLNSYDFISRNTPNSLPIIKDLKKRNYE